MTRFTDLTPTQIRLMIRLDDGYPHEDSVGIMLTDLPDKLVADLQSLRRLGLIEFHKGWRAEIWTRLTEAGRQVRDEGQSR